MGVEMGMGMKMKISSFLIGWIMDGWKWNGHSSFH
jgi:hypothetical protein